MKMLDFHRSKGLQMRQKLINICRVPQTFPATLGITVWNVFHLDITLSITVNDVQTKVNYGVTRKLVDQ